MGKAKKKTIPEKISTKHLVIYDRMFEQQVDVFLNYSAGQYEKWLNKNKIKDVSTKEYTEENYAGWTANYTCDDGQVKAILFIPKFQWAIRHQGTLIHEITHVIIKIWARNNIPFTPDNQEFLASSIGRMYEDIAHKLLAYCHN